MVTLTLFVLLLAVHFILGAYAGWYHRFGWFGAGTHVLGGCFILSLTQSVLATFFIAVLWECFEYAFDRAFPNHSDWVCWYSRDFDRALYDIMFTVMGAGLWTMLQ